MKLTQAKLTDTLKKLADEKKQFIKPSIISLPKTPIQFNIKCGLNKCKCNKLQIPPQAQTDNDKLLEIKKLELEIEKLKLLKGEQEI